jgi:hypothetical protein
LPSAILPQCRALPSQGALTFTVQLSRARRAHHAGEERLDLRRDFLAVVGFLAAPVRSRLLVVMTIAGPGVAAGCAFLHRGDRFVRCT